MARALQGRGAPDKTADPAPGKDSAMTSPFTRPALICNTQSGSHDDAVREQIAELCRTHGAPLAATFALPEGDIPDAAALKRQGIDLLLVWTGDGTITRFTLRFSEDMVPL
eukprot:gene2332-3034_t